MAFTRFLVAVSCCASLWVGAQENRYMVFYTDKIGSPFSVATPEQFLSDRSIARRVNQAINITELDLPVNASYQAQVAGTGATVLFSSKWFNASLVEATDSEVAALQGLTCVQSLERVAPGKNGTGSRKRNKWAKQSGESPTVNAKQNEMLGIEAMHADGFRGEGILIAVLDLNYAPAVNCKHF